ncbi:RidA family protein [Leucobacter luti]|uniref:2-iminobutanoate/2-iminopropanoate deaminase n=1 Tax=Leucobacter luti TaxID=340320 RepID=A0A4R6S2D8_9MICO|nr:Rid family hydrolase [Leucobacter luti]MCW2289186.1 enamine deaminase RidA (YjgF/YER057c/UK114 family) [Leucobacter luti]QYM74991.1 RidA family protein [Leucobacter luti]TCK39751.1 2-iminobutanoate/2-iminopropanoate deaminase [Leucobacter luti]TDP93404.1 2-iminobutanoate/2-iminopropanoate deaminase [Leucobacter luti]
MPRRQSIYLTGFAHANPVPVASRIGPFVHSGVLTGRDPATGEMPVGLSEQCANVFAHIRELMAAVGGTPDDIAKISCHLVSYRDRAALNFEWEVMFPEPENRPARQVMAATLDGGALIHCDLIAVLGERSPDPSPITAESAPPT